MRVPASVVGPALLAILISTGCGKHYWGKEGATAEEFARDSGACARENALYMSGPKDYGIVMEDRYRACLRSRGWVRAQHHEPPSGWFRGIEGDEPVKFDAPVPSTAPGPRSSLPAGPPGDAPVPTSESLSAAAR
jgi:hypothetical protein